MAGVCEAMLSLPCMNETAASNYAWISITHTGLYVTCFKAGRKMNYPHQSWYLRL